MEQNLKELLLKDLSSRLPYGLKCKICLDEYCGWNPEYDKILADAAKVKPELPSEIRENTYTLYGIEGTRAILLEFEDHGYGVPIEFIKPFLRSMPSMTEEERNELSHYDNSVQRTDFFYSHHIDCRYMIEKGLALEASENMYNINER